MSDQFTEWDPIEEKILDLVDTKDSTRSRIVSDLFKTTYKFVKENYGTLSLKIMATTLRELRYSFKIFTPHKKTPKITMFGSARVPPNTPLYQMAREFAEQAVERGFMIITGGGPG